MPPDSPRPTPAAIDAHYLPLMAAAAQTAAERRDGAWLFQLERTVCGVPVRAMTLADLIALRLSGNAHVTPLQPAAEEDPVAFWAKHSCIFLWRISCGYRASREALVDWQRRHDIAGLDFEVLHREITAYIAEAFADWPRPLKVEGESSPVSGRLGVGFAACWIHDFAQAYGWTAAETLALPLPALFQLRRLLQVEADIKAGRDPLPVGDEVDRLAAAAFAEIEALSP